MREHAASTQAPIVSVIVPVYRAQPEHFEACLTSLAAQGLTSDELEVCVVFDGAPSHELLEVTEGHSGSLTLATTVNAHEGVAAARNVGLSMAHGTWLAFADADDALPAESLARLVDFAVAHDCDLVMGNHVNVSSNGFSEAYVHAETDQPPTAELLERLRHDVLSPSKNSGCVWGKLYRRAFVEGSGLCFDASLAKGSDAEFIFRLAQVGPRYGIAAMSAYEYHRREESIVRTWRPDYADLMLCTMQKMRANVAALPDAEAYRSELCDYVVFHLMLVLVHYLCNPKATWTGSERRAEFYRVLAEPLFQEALDGCDDASFSRARRVTVHALRRGSYAACYAIGTVRQLQLGGPAAYAAARRARLADRKSQGGGSPGLVPRVACAPVWCGALA